MKKLYFVVLFFCVSNLFAQENITVFQDHYVKYEIPSGLPLKKSTLDALDTFIKPARKNLNRKKETPVPETIKEQFYLKTEASHTVYYDMRKFMYVSSRDGLRIRENPSLKSEKVCTVPYGSKLIITAVGERVVIDGIDSAWIEVLIPYYETKVEGPSFGWVFGGYLTSENIEDEYHLLNEDLPWNYKSLFNTSDGILFPKHTKELYSIYYNKDNEKQNIRDAVKSENNNYYYGKDLEKMYKSALDFTVQDIILISCGIEDTYNGPSLFLEYWYAVWQNRQVYPFSFKEDLNGSQIVENNEDSITIGKSGEYIEFVNNESKNRIEIPYEYQKDFIKRKNDFDLKIYYSRYYPDDEDNQYEEYNQLEKELFIYVTRQVINEDNTFHSEITFFIYKNNKLTKFAFERTASDFIPVDCSNCYIKILQRGNTMFEYVYAHHYYTMINWMMDDSNYSLKIIPEPPYVIFKSEDFCGEDFFKYQDVLQSPEE